MSLVKNIVALCCLSAVLSGCGAASKSVSSPANNNSAPSVSLEHKEALKTISEREAAISAKLGRKDMSSDHSGRSFMTIASPKRQLKATPRHHSRTASSYKNIEGKRYDYNYSYRDSWGEIDEIGRAHV